MGCGESKPTEKPPQGPGDWGHWYVQQHWARYPACIGIGTFGAFEAGSSDICGFAAAAITIHLEASVVGEGGAGVLHVAVDNLQRAGQGLRLCLRCGRRRGKAH